MQSVTSTQHSSSIAISNPPIYLSPKPVKLKSAILVSFALCSPLKVKPAILPRTSQPDGIEPHKYFYAQAAMVNRSIYGVWDVFWLKFSLASLSFREALQLLNLNESLKLLESRVAKSSISSKVKFQFQLLNRWRLQKNDPCQICFLRWKNNWLTCWNEYLWCIRERGSKFKRWWSTRLWTVSRSSLKIANRLNPSKYSTNLRTLRLKTISISFSASWRKSLSKISPLVRRASSQHFINPALHILFPTTLASSFSIPTAPWVVLIASTLKNICQIQTIPL